MEPPNSVPSFLEGTQQLRFKLYPKATFLFPLQLDLYLENIHSFNLSVTTKILARLIMKSFLNA